MTATPIRLWPRSGMEGFQEFMQNPDRLDQILERIEAERARIYGAL